MMRKFEDLPNEILLDCFEYFHATDLLFSFGQLNHRFDQVIQTLPLHLDFQHVHKSVYDVLCQQMLIDWHAQKRIYSLQLSNENTPGQINDFLSKFSLDQFSHLRSLTFIDLQDNNMTQLKRSLPLLSQITTCHLLGNGMNQNELQSLLPIDNLLTLSINSNLILIGKTIPMISLTLFSLSLNEICRLFPYTPFLQYLNVSQVRDRRLSTEYHQSTRPAHLKQIIVTYFRPKFNDLTHFIQDMSNLQSLTVGSSNDNDMLDASRWERLIQHSLPSLIDLRFKLITDYWIHPCNVVEIFDRFQTSFWLKEHQWYTECAVHRQSMMIYTIPYISEGIQIPLVSKRSSNPLIDHSQTFKHVKKLVVSARDLFQCGDYYFPNIESLSIKQSPKMSTANDEEQVMESLMKLVSFSHLKHLEISWRCRTQRPSLLLRILELAPKLSSLFVEPCFLQLLSTHPESNRYLNEKIKKLVLFDWFPHECKRPFKMRSLHQLIPNLQRLTTSISKPEDWLFLLDQFSKLSSFQVDYRSSIYPEGFEHFKSEAWKRGAIIEETVEKHSIEFRIIFTIWIGRP